MPIDRYFKGHGAEVMSDMVDRYGARKGKSVFYATANKRKGMKPTARDQADALRKEKH